MLSNQIVLACFRMNTEAAGRALAGTFNWYLYILFSVRWRCLSVFLYQDLRASHKAVKKLHYQEALCDACLPSRARLILFVGGWNAAFVWHINVEGSFQGYPNASMAGGGPTAPSGHSDSPNGGFVSFNLAFNRPTSPLSPPPHLSQYSHLKSSVRHFPGPQRWQWH